MPVTLKRASVRDAERIWKMQIEAFSALLQKYQDYDTSPAAEPIEKVIRRLQQPHTYFYFILEDEETVGAVRVVDMKDPMTRKRISLIFVMQQYRSCGIAQEAILEAEMIHGAEHWALDTILQEKALCRLYEKMGYRQTGKTEKINDKLTLVFYEK